MGKAALLKNFANFTYILSGSLFTGLIIAYFGWKAAAFNEFTPLPALHVRLLLVWLLL